MEHRKVKPLLSVSRRTFNRRIRQNMIQRRIRNELGSENVISDSSGSTLVNNYEEMSEDTDGVVDNILQSDDNILSLDNTVINEETQELDIVLNNSGIVEEEDLMPPDEYGDFYNVLNSDSELELDDESDNEFGDDTLGKELSDWARNSIPLSKTTELLKILREHGHVNLPKVAQTLLGTPQQCTKIPVSPGDYVHIGIRKNIIKLIASMANPPLCLKLDINIDGVPITNSTKKQFWPILCRCVELSLTPFVIGLYYGLKKPDSCSDYLKRFVDEVKEILENGITFCNTFYTIKLNAIICDAPAQAFVKGIVGHNAYHGCGRCTQSGEWLNGRLSFNELEINKRTDLSFKEKWDEDHHKTNSILEDLGIGMVTQFPSDYLHLLCLGVPKKLLLFWTSGPLRTRLPFFKQQEISHGLHNCKIAQPIEFQRRCRGIDELCYWKGSEFRTFLLYTGPV